MGYNQQKGGHGIDAVCSTIKSLESGSNNTSGESSSPILKGGSSATTHPDFSGIGSGGFKGGSGTVVRRQDMQNGAVINNKRK